MSIIASITLMRPINSLMVGFAVLVGVVIASPKMIFSPQSLLGFMTGFFISSYSMVVNDCYDLEVDRVNNPHKPLPSGKVTIKSAILLSIVLLMIGLFSAILISTFNFLIALTFAIIAWIYNSWGKRKGLIGNMMVALSVSIPYIYGGFAIGKLDDLLIWFLTIISFLAATGREVVKTISDVEGDKLRDVKSVARVYGSAYAARFSATLFLVAVTLSFLPIIFRIVGLTYTLLILIPDAIFVYASISILKDYTPQNALRIKKVTLMGMFMGLVSFVVGGVFRF
ncbi:MAG: UbiA family prenyltransferase [Nitrososphaerota archaeon]|nr:UbiA family prenyltransferase [Nitrososphaerales archaeon]MDW8045354.1 UbiA family prenyltransferase [Nitrososphaerota archaeon]